jgi:asparagine synthase (glutamine-hydrolysing)
MELNEAGYEFRRLLESAVLRCLNPGAQTWAHLSGGLDSSSVVSTAAVLNERGVTDKRLGGTITLTDSLGNADESDFADAVVRRFNLHNERVADDWPWRSDGAPPPLTDQPARDYPFYARDRLMARIITDHGGTALLSGVGPDHCLPVTSYHMPDLIWTGRFGEGARELYRWTIATRDSLWRVTFRHMLAPLLAPRWYALREVHGSEVPAWITANFAARCDFHHRLAAQHDPGKRGRFYQSASRRSLSRIACWLPAWFDLPGIKTRHPFLYLPLVEFCLRLSYRLRTDACQSKPVLRAAMNGVLPEKVRQRFTKGMLDPRICWALGKERQQLSRLLAGSVLADLGCIEPKRALAEVDSHATGVGGNAGFLYPMLSLETWLSTRSGRCGV